MKPAVLLIEDERDTRELLTSALDRAGYRCVAAGDADAAMQAAKGGDFFDVVVTDVVFGGDDHGGLRLMSKLRAAGVRAPVIVITAYADVEKVKSALNEGALHLLEKPFRAAELLAVVGRACVHAGDVRHAIDQIFLRAKLTAKERAVARYLLDGLSSSEIAEVERNSSKTIRQHVSQIYAKCGVGSRAEFFRLVYAR